MARRARQNDPPVPGELAAALGTTWSRRPGFVGWLTTTDHKEIGLRFVATAFVFFLLGGVLALMMRLQLAAPRNTLIGPDLYNQLFTTHGTTMMFLFAVPVMEGMGLYLVPLMVGARNVAFPRLMNFGYYLYAMAGALLYAGLLLDTGPDMGWFSYVPLAGPDYGPGKRVDVWSQMVTMVEISTLVGAVEIITTAFKLRAPGMSLRRIPLFVWAEIVTSFMILFAMPSVMLCSTMLATDRMTNVNTHFFNPAEGGDPLLWQHMFWFFAHPEVYIIFLPATGFVSAILPTFARRKMFGHTALVLASASVAFIGFGVWVHHMFATPLPQLGQGLFTASSLMIVVPNSVQFFCWVATLWGGRPHVRMPMVWVLGFFATFLIGGLTGVMLASVSINTQVHDTFFVVAHLHYVLIGGAIFPLFGAFYYWFPKWTGRLLSERIGLWNFALMFAGFHLTFFPLHELGLRGMPRRVYTYAAETGWGPLNHAATVGAFLLGLGVLVFLFNVVRSRRRGRVAGPNPWGAGTLEWAVPSPPPGYSFLHPPTVRSDEPVWEDPDDTPVVAGLRTEVREIVVTTANEAIPDLRHTLPPDSIWPPLLALGVGGSFVGFVFHPAAFPIGAAITFVVLVGWFWPRKDQRPDPSMTAPPPDDVAAGRPSLDVSGLPTSALGSRHPGWWGNTLFMAIETTTIVMLVMSYFYTRQANDEWPPIQSNLGSSALDPRPSLGLATVDVLLLLASCFPAAWMHRAAVAKDRAQTAWGLAAVVGCGALAIVLRFAGLGGLKFRWDDNAFGSLVWAVVVIHLTYLIAAVLEAAVTLLWVLLYGVDEKKTLNVHLTTIYWWWMAGTWAVLYGTVYWSPRIL